MNTVTVCGCLATPIMEIEDKGIYQFDINTERVSGIIDKLPCIIRESDLDNRTFNKGDKVILRGEFRSRNVQDIEGKSHLQLYIFVQVLNFATNEDSDSDDIKVSGTVCKLPIKRSTPSGKIITDILLAVNRDGNNKSDYIPMISWNATAKKLAELIVGDKIEITGRIQSRIYTKDGEDRTAYEVNIRHFEKI